MFRYFCFAALSVVIFSGGQVLAAYCSASVSVCDEYICQVQVGTINNTTGYNNYSDYTSMSTTMQPGAGYQITVVSAINGTLYAGYPGDQLGIWVDWNGDQDFYDSGETICAIAGDSYFQTWITPPAGTSAGNKRMRVRLTYTGTLSPCGSSNYGEVEDYTIVIPSANNGKISGYKFHDSNGNAKWDTSESGLSGWEIFLDTNGNKVWNSSEPKTTTNSSGYYEFTGLAAGSYTITEVQQSGWYQTFPGDEGRYTESLGAGGNLTNKNFGNKQISGTLIVIPATADTYASSANPTTNYGSETGFSVGKSSTTVTRAYLKFNLSAIPAGQIIRSARLRLENSYRSNPGPELMVYRLSDNWQESSVTWNSKPLALVGVTPGTNSQLVDSGLTVWDVQGDVDNDYISDSNFSAGIMSIDENVITSASYWSKDLGWAPTAPKLEVEYGPFLGGGTGTETDPYQVWTGEQMNTIGLYKNRWAKSYKLMADISLSAYSSNYNVIGRPANTSAGTVSFTGVFDGDFHNISGFSPYSSCDYFGIFGYISEPALIKNLKLISPVISDPYQNNSYVGTLAGYMNSGNIYGCSVVDGSVQGKSYIGGMVGTIAGFVSASSSSANASGADNVGGFTGAAGTVYGMSGITDCYARGNVSGSTNAGGFAGGCSDSILVNCYSTGTVSGGSNKGGFCGYYESMYFAVNVTGCFWDMTSSGISTSALGTGKVTSAMQNINTFLQAGWDFANETANGGTNNWVMPATGGYPVLWYEPATAPALPSFAGGSGTTASPYIIATKDQLNCIGSNQRLLDKHFRLSNDIEMSGDQLKMIAERPYQFSGTFDGMGHVIRDVLIKPVFNASSVGFVGNLRGSGAAVRNLTLTDANVWADCGVCVGAIVGKNYSGTVENCHSINGQVWGLTSVGGLVGQNYWYGVVRNCSASGSVKENTVLNILFSGVGGLVGENCYWSRIENSYAKCQVNGDDCLGGMAGSNIVGSSIENCYSGGSVTGTASMIGGLVGRNLATSIFKNSYSATEVTVPVGVDAGAMFGSTASNCIYTACFWDNQVCTLPGIAGSSNANVIGKSTAEMKTLSTFTGAGWDMVNTWSICSGTNYPKLKLQLQGADMTCPDGVDFKDFAVLAGEWMQQGCGVTHVCNADLDESGAVNFYDLIKFADWWLE